MSDSGNKKTIWPNWKMGPTGGTCPTCGHVFCWCGGQDFYPGEESPHTPGCQNEKNYIPAAASPETAAQPSKCPNSKCNSTDRAYRGKIVIIYDQENVEVKRCSNKWHDEGSTAFPATDVSGLAAKMKDSTHTQSSSSAEAAQPRSMPCNICGAFGQHANDCPKKAAQPLTHRLINRADPECSPCTPDCPACKAEAPQPPEEFEKWAIKKYYAGKYGAVPTRDGRYLDDDVEDAWQGWQAARAGMGEQQEILEKLREGLALIQGLDLETDYYINGHEQIKQLLNDWLKTGGELYWKRETTSLRPEMGVKE